MVRSRSAGNRQIRRAVSIFRGGLSPAIDLPKPRASQVIDWRDPGAIAGRPPDRSVQTR